MYFSEMAVYILGAAISAALLLLHVKDAVKVETNYLKM